MELFVREEQDCEDKKRQHDSQHNSVRAHQRRVHSQVLLKKISKVILVKKFYRIVLRGGVG